MPGHLFTIYSISSCGKKKNGVFFLLWQRYENEDITSVFHEKIRIIPAMSIATPPQINQKLSWCLKLGCLLANLKFRVKNANDLVKIWKTPGKKEETGLEKFPHFWEKVLGIVVVVSKRAQKQLKLSSSKKEI
ncbi:hypothetical protein TNIN_488421 [Trichonephila inaurata madagascariensis]|uniref:Uncharacterized protein n=1 Tax=Trichonephila inaurata madagascariensis TaxID=2747483 RepID=A0A8X6KH38_9ARAC|nr:hypothetical protein TNIN_488421 [Trichonephila inaurata madagascariensis]